MITMPMFTKLATVVTYGKKLSPKKSYDLLISCSCEFTLKIKYVTFSLAEDLWAPSGGLP